MKSIFTILLLLITFSLSAQISTCDVKYAQYLDSSFADLRGFEDKNGDVFLYYRISESKHFNCNIPYTEYSNSIYCFDLNTKLNYFKFGEYGGYYDAGIPFSGWYNGMTDFEFWQKDTSNLFFASFGCGIDCSYSIGKNIGRNKYATIIGGGLNFATDIDISQQDSNLIIVNDFGRILLTYEGTFQYLESGKSYLEFFDFNQMSIFPTNDSLMLGVYNDWSHNCLKKSYDRGQTFQTIDSTLGWAMENKTKPFEFSTDGSVIYSLLDHYPVYRLAVSKDFGESWEIVYSDSSKFFFSFAPQNPSEVFITKDNSILKSENYGSTFLPYQTVKEDFLGIYKHPSQDLVYAITKNNLYELNSDHATPLLKIVTGVSDKPVEPETFTLFQNYPNPFNPTTQIRFYNPKTAQIKIDIYDSLGRLVETINNQIYTPGNHSIEFNASNLTSGIYFYSVQADNFQKTGKMTLIR